MVGTHPIHPVEVRLDPCPIEQAVNEAWFPCSTANGALRLLTLGQTAGVEVVATAQLGALTGVGHRVQTDDTVAVAGVIVVVKLAQRLAVGDDGGSFVATTAREGRVATLDHIHIGTISNITSQHNLGVWPLWGVDTRPHLQTSKQQEKECVSTVSYDTQNGNIQCLQTLPKDSADEQCHMAPITATHLGK